MALPLFNNSNYRLTSESGEVVGKFSRRENGKILAGWEMRVPDAGADGVPFKIIFAGPSFDHRGSAFRLHLTTKEGDDLPGDAEVVLETAREDGDDRKTVFQGKYQQFIEIPDQQATDAAIALQKRSEVNKGYTMRLTVTVPDGASTLDPSAEGSFFEVEVYKVWLNMSA